MAQLWVNAIEGALDAQLNNGSTTISGLFLADLPAVSGSDYVVLTIDPDSAHDDPEIVHVTAHTASATTATILRAQESTTEPATPWPLGTAVAATVTKASLDALDSAIAANAAGVTQAGNDLNTHESSVNHPTATTSSKGMMSNTDKAKLDGIEANAKNDQAITAGSGITVTGSGDVSIAHADTTTHGSVNNGGSTVLQDLIIDDFGHATDINSVTITPALIGAEPALTGIYDFIKTNGYRVNTGLPSLDGDTNKTIISTVFNPPGDWGNYVITATFGMQVAQCESGFQCNMKLRIGTSDLGQVQSGNAVSTTTDPSPPNGVVHTTSATYAVKSGPQTLYLRAYRSNNNQTDSVTKYAWIHYTAIRTT